MLNKPDSILIVGGGTAGWMTANSFLRTWPDCQITLIESDDIGVIGVGEGATPYLKQYFRQLNISEQEWMPACDATYKVGISFEGWSGKSEAKSYFHPFFSVLDKQPAEMFFHNCGLRRRGFNASAHPDDYFVAKELAKQQVNPTTALKHGIDIDYAYHFDSVKLGQFLRGRAVKSGLTHIIDTVTDIQLDEQGAIKQVNALKNGSLTASFFIDCTGFSGKLIHQALQQNYKSYQENLFNNAAVAIQTPRTAGSIITPQTKSVALKAGWMWNIPLTTRQGNGYVYADGYISSDQAEIELRQTLGIQDNDEVTVRHLKMRVGRLEQHWYKNCLAVGLSQGFIEPLEATALMLTQLTVERFTEVFSNESQSIEDIRNQYNKQLNLVFDGIREYIVAHYQLSHREDTPYWKDNKGNSAQPEVLKAILHAWDNGLDVESVLTEYKQNLVYLRPSWYCILAGMGRFPNKLKATSQAADVEQAMQYCKGAVSQYFSRST